MRRASALLASVVIALLAVGVTAAPASAHASLVSTDPAEGAVLPEAPDQVTFTFDEPVALAPDGLHLYDDRGQPVGADATARDDVVAAQLPDLDDGTYVVVWRVVSADGHPVAGSLTFSVGAPSETVTPPDTGPTDDRGLRPVIAIVQAIDYVALLVAGGLVIFASWVVRGVRVAPKVVTRLARIRVVGSGVAVVAAALLVPLTGAYQRGVGARGLAEAASLDPALVRDPLTVLGLHVLGLGAVALIDRRGGSPQLIAGAAAAAVWSPALVGHTQAYEPAALLVLTDAIHLSAAAVWLGGLVGLVVALPRLAGRPRDAALVLTRFSTLGGALLAVLAVTGVLLGWRILGAWAPLWEETWGRLLLAKLGIALLVVAVAGWNRLRLLPRVAGAGHDASASASRTVHRTVVAETALLVVLLAVTGFLTGQAPRGDGPSAPPTAATGVGTAIAGDVRVLALVDAGEGRQRRLLVQVQDSAGEPLELFRPPALSLRAAGVDAVDLGDVPLEPTGSGTYLADVSFPTLGEWEAQVSLPVTEFDNPVVTVTIQVE